jgi:hypothetical protein
MMIATAISSIAKAANSIQSKIVSPPAVLAISSRSIKDYLLYFSSDDK